LAKAIDLLRRRGLPYVGLFVGNGPQGEEIAQYPACTVTPFMKHLRLADFYRAADIGVWPAHDSMSMLDAGACGLPIVVSERLAAVERYQGNGLTYREPDAESLASVLASLLQEEVRRELGDCGAQKVRERFSWLANAKARLEYYGEACGVPDAR
jgi:glycosyltransferase involved in cell wall biosynthesis